VSPITLFLVERPKTRGLVHEWTDALCTRLGHVPPSLFDGRLTCRTAGEAGFVGCIEHGDVGEITIARITTTTSHRLVTAQQEAAPSSCPVVLLFQTGGSCRVEQAGASCTLYPGDWCLHDTRQPLRIDALDRRNENLSVRLEPPSDAETLRLLSNVAARRWSAATGTSRILRATVAETFDQLNCLSHLGNGLERAITSLVWQAVREQLDAPVSAAHQNLQISWVKRFIDSRLQDPHLSVDAIAEACRISVRSLYRAFSNDSAGSVSKYLWTRRLDHCAAALRDPRQQHRPVTEICFAWGFNSSSHFSRIFKSRFGCTPSEYRVYFKTSGVPFEPQDGNN
jgi:AraC family transcriptional regulator, positive regulator of tynA and feaB